MSIWNPDRHAMKSDDLNSLIDRFLAGDSREFRSIRSQISNYVYRQNFGSNQDRDDVISDTMVALLACFRERRFRADSIQALNVFIYMTVRNQIVKRLRRQWRTSENFDEQIDWNDGQRNVAEIAAEKALADRIYNSLDPECRRLLWHKFHLHWSDQEIADHFKKSKNAISTAICRCLNKARSFQGIKKSGNN